MARAAASPAMAMNASWRPGRSMLSVSIPAPPSISALRSGSGPPAGSSKRHSPLTFFASAGIAFLSSAAIFIPMARRGRLRGRDLLVGGAFYVLYLGLVVAVISGAIG